MSSEQDPVLKSIEETKVVYKRLGKSGLKVSVPILGAMSFGDPAWAPWVVKEDVGLPLLKAAYDRGLNTWDTGKCFSVAQLFTPRNPFQVVVANTLLRSQQTFTAMAFPRPSLVKRSRSTRFPATKSSS